MCSCNATCRLIYARVRLRTVGARMGEREQPAAWARALQGRKSRHSPLSKAVWARVEFELGRTTTPWRREGWAANTLELQLPTSSVQPTNPNEQNAPLACDETALLLMRGVRRVKQGAF